MNLYWYRWGPIPWLLGAEIFPLRARAKGMALSTSTNWVSNFIIAFITPPLISATGGGYYFLLLGFSLISLISVFFAYRETAGKTLEQLGEVFGDGKVAIDLLSEPGIMPPTTSDGPERSKECMLEKAIVAEPLGILADEGIDSASSTHSFGVVSVSDPLLSAGTDSNQIALVEIPLDDEPRRNPGNGSTLNE